MPLLFTVLRGIGPLRQKKSAGKKQKNGDAQKDPENRPCEKRGEATIVIFDRIRENMRSMKKTDDLKDVINASITQTLTRSIYTSFTTFVMVAVLYVMGVTSIKEFALPLIVGIVCGAYSSVCITGPLWYVMKTRLGKKKVQPVPVKASGKKKSKSKKKK